MTRRRLLPLGMLLILTGNSLGLLGRATDTAAEFIVGWIAIWAVSGLAAWVIYHHTKGV